MVDVPTTRALLSPFVMAANGSEATRSPNTKTASPFFAACSSIASMVLGASCSAYTFGPGAKAVRVFPS